MAKKKIDLAKEAAETANDATVIEITDALLREVCPKALLARFKSAKTPAARADLLYAVEHAELKEARNALRDIDIFVTKLEQWFIQEFKESQTGVTGKLGRVEVKNKEIATVEDWSKFYKHIAKKQEFDLLNKAINQKAIQERWGQEKEVPGVGKFIKKVISLTGVKGK